MDMVTERETEPAARSLREEGIDEAVRRVLGGPDAAFLHRGARPEAIATPSWVEAIRAEWRRIVRQG